MTEAIAIDEERLQQYCRRWKITQLALFGSVLREDFRSDSVVKVRGGIGAQRTR